MWPWHISTRRPRSTARRSRGAAWATAIPSSWSTASPSRRHRSIRSSIACRVPRRVITLDLRGHGESGSAADYGLAAMAGDVAAVVSAAGAAAAPHLVGHSLGGAVVTAAGAATPGAQRRRRRPVAAARRLQGAARRRRGDAARPRAVHARDRCALRVDDGRPASVGREQQRVNALRHADQEVILGVWDLLLTQPVDEIARTVDEALGGYATAPVPYLALFGIDPATPTPSGWPSGSRVPRSSYWTDHGHYPHLVDPDRFVARLPSSGAHESSRAGGVPRTANDAGRWRSPCSCRWRCRSRCPTAMSSGRRSCCRRRGVLARRDDDRRPRSDRPSLDLLRRVMFAPGGRDDHRQRRRGGRARQGDPRRRPGGDRHRAARHGCRRSG